MDGLVIQGAGGALAGDGSGTFTSDEGHFRADMRGWTIRIGDQTYVIDSVVDAYSVVLKGGPIDAAIAATDYAIAEGFAVGVQNFGANMTAALNVTDPEVSATLGFLGVSAGGAGSGSGVSFDLAGTLGAQRADGGTRFTLDDIISGAFAGAVDLSVQSANGAQAVLRGFRADGGLAALDLAGLEISLYAGDPLNIGDTFVLQYTPGDTVDIDGAMAERGLAANTLVAVLPDLSAFTNLGDLSFEDVLAAVRQGIELLDDALAEQSFYRAVLPLLNTSLQEAIGFTDDVLAALDDLEGTAVAALDGIEKALEDALGITDTGDDPETEAVALFLRDDGDLGLRINFREVVAKALSLNLNIADLAAAVGVDAGMMRALTDLVGAGAEGQIDLRAVGELSLDLKIGLDDFGDASVEILGFSDADGRSGTFAAVDLSLVGRNIAATVNVGPAQLGISGGKVAFDGDGDANTEDSATLLIGVNGSGSGDLFSVQASGDFSLDLPVELSVGGFSLNSFLDDPIGITLESLEGYGLKDLTAALDAAADFDPLAAFDFDLPDLEGLLDSFDISTTLLGLLADPGQVIDGIDIVLGELDGLFEGMFSDDIPLIGDALTAPGSFIGDIRSGLLADLKASAAATGDGGLITLLGDSLDSVLGGHGLDLLVDGIDITLHDESGALLGSFADDPSLAAEADAVEFSFDLADTLLATGADLPLDLDIPGFSLSVDGGFALDVGWQARLGFGISVTDGVYLVDRGGDGAELTFGANAYLDNTPNDPTLSGPFSGSAKVLFFEAVVTDQGRRNGEASGVQVNADLDLKGNASGRVTLGDLFGGRPIKDVAEIALEADAEVRLGARLSADMGDSGLDGLVPELVTDIVIEGYYGLSSVQTDAPEFSVSFENFGLDVGSVLNDFLLPVVDQIESTLEPAAPVLDLFADSTDRAPNLGLGFIGISTPRDLVDVLVSLTGGKPVDWSFIDAADFVINDLADRLRAMGDTGILMFGDFAGFGDGEIVQSTYRLDVALDDISLDLKLQRLISDGMSEADANRMIELAALHADAFAEGATRAAIAAAGRIEDAVREELLALDGMSLTDAAAFVDAVAGPVRRHCQLPPDRGQWRPQRRPEACAAGL